MNDEVKNDKIADNRFIENFKDKINIIDEQIDHQKNTMKSLDRQEELINEIRKVTEECNRLLNESIKGKKTRQEIYNIEQAKKNNYKKIMNDIEQSREIAKKDIVILNQEKYGYEKQRREINNKLSDIKTEEE